MDFIRDDEYIMLGANLRQLDQCVFFPDNTARIMRVAKDQDLTMFIDNRFEIFKIHLVNAVYHFKRIVNNLAMHAFRNDAEGMVNRWLYNYFVARFGEALDDKADAFDNSRNIAEPFPFDLPVLFIMYPFYNTIIIRV